METCQDCLVATLTRHKVAHTLQLSSKVSRKFSESDQNVIKNAKMAGKKGLSDEEILRRLEESDSDNFSDLLSDTESNDSGSEEEDNERPPIDVIPEKRIPTQSSGDTDPAPISTYSYIS